MLRIITGLFLTALFAPEFLLSQSDLPPLKSGKYEVSLRLPPEGLVPEEEMQIEMRVVDTTQVDPILGPTPIIRAKITATVEMPTMPGMPKVEEIAHPEGVAGEYGIHPTFAHGGEFLLRLTVTPPTDNPFTVQFPLVVADGADPKRKPGIKPFKVEMTSSPKSPKAGESVELTLVVKRQATLGAKKNNSPELVTEFEKVHEQYMHLIIVRKDLGSFSHEHPEVLPDGVFKLRYTFPSGGEYHLFADTAPKGAGSQILLSKLKISGKAGEKFDLTNPPASAKTFEKLVDGISVSLVVPEKLPARKTTTVTAKLRVNGQPVQDLQPYLGAMGHLILIHEDGTTFVHSHPDERDANSGRNGDIPFLSRAPKPGLYRGWVQFRRQGKVSTADFIVQAAEGATE